MAKKRNNVTDILYDYSLHEQPMPHRGDPVRARTAHRSLHDGGGRWHQEKESLPEKTQEAEDDDEGLNNTKRLARVRTVQKINKKLITRKMSILCFIRITLNSGQFCCSATCQCVRIKGLKLQYAFAVTSFWF